MCQYRRRRPLCSIQNSTPLVQKVSYHKQRSTSDTKRRRTHQKPVLVLGNKVPQDSLRRPSANATLPSLGRGVGTDAPAGSDGHVERLPTCGGPAASSLRQRSGNSLFSVRPVPAVNSRGRKLSLTSSVTVSLLRHPQARDPLRMRG